MVHTRARMPAPQHADMMCRQRPDEFELDDNMDPYETEEEQGLVGMARVGSKAALSRQISHFTPAHDHYPKVQSLSDRSLPGLPPHLMQQKSGNIRSQGSDIAVMYASDDDTEDSKGARF